MTARTDRKTWSEAEAEIRMGCGRPLHTLQGDAYKCGTGEPLLKLCLDCDRRLHQAEREEEGKLHKQWEYDICWLSGPPTQVLLDLKGIQGWELVTFTNGPERFAVYFKRRCDHDRPRNER